MCLISTAWALAAHEPLTAHTYTGPWDSGLKLGAIEPFGGAGNVLDCATQPATHLKILTHTRCFTMSM